MMRKSLFTFSFAFKKNGMALSTEVNNNTEVRNFIINYQKCFYIITQFIILMF
jgi:hypothetical protein